MKALVKAEKIMGGRGPLARALGVTREGVRQWHLARVPAEQCPRIERLTGVPRAELRPDLYGPAQ
jgi:DNA-binding transcriptional regulator YdaS (Cro superfamily)